MRLRKEHRRGEVSTTIKYSKMFLKLQDEACVSKRKGHLTIIHLLLYITVIYEEKGRFLDRFPDMGYP